MSETTENKSFIQRAEDKKNKAITQSAKAEKKAQAPVVASNPEKKSSGKVGKVVDGVEYTAKSESTPLEKFQSISDATSTTVTGRRPGFRAWGQLGIKIGQEIFYKHHPEIKAIVESEVTNQIKVMIPDKDDFITFGVIPAENHVREHLGVSKKGAEGFDMWGFHLQEDDKTKWRSVYDLYCAVFRK